MSIAATFDGGRTKFNPNHASDGRFAHGGGGGHAGGEHLSPDRVEALKGEVSALGASKGEDWRLEVTGPRTPKEEAGLAKAEAKERFLVERKVEPKRETLRQGDRTTHVVGGETAAETFHDGTTDRWVSREHGISWVAGETRDNPYKTRERAEANSQKWADAAAREQTVREYSTPKRLEEHFRTERESLIGGGPSATFATTTFRVIVPQAGASKALRLKDMGDRGAEGFIPPGDGEDPHEDNTFGLPNGTPIAREYRRFLRRIKKEVLGTLPTIGAPVVIRDPDLTDWQDPMQTAMTPLLSAYWDEAGKETRARLGLDPDEWRVVDPHLHAAIEQQSHAFCQSTLATTAETVGDAYRFLNAELVAGLVTEGESIPELAKRVRSIFHGLSREHSVMIARTESSRAVHAASELSAKESGVVSGKVWLLSSNACEKCHEVARRTNETPIPLGVAFAQEGNNPTYSTVRMPPLHPHCLLPGTPIVAPGAISGVKVQFQGPIVRIATEDGSRFAVTWNHHFLTPTGFARAHQLVKGDDLIRCALTEQQVSRDHDEHYKPTVIEEVFESLAKVLGVDHANTGLSPVDLHGDATFAQGDVDVVSTRRPLLNEFIDAAIQQPTGESVFFRAAPAKVSLLGGRMLSEALFAMRDATDGGVGSVREAKSLFWRGGRHAESQSFTERASLDSRVGHPGSDGATGDAERLRDTLKTFSGFIATSKIASIDFEHYKGPVYDIETTSSLYAIDRGIVSSNCRCSVTYRLTPEYQALVDANPPETYQPGPLGPEPREVTKKSFRRKFNPNHDAAGRFSTGHGGGHVRVGNHPESGVPADLDPGAPGLTIGQARKRTADNIEKAVARAVGGEWKTGNEPADAAVAKPGGGLHQIEVKSKTFGAKESLSVHDAALENKVNDQIANPKNTWHSVMVDRRDTSEGGAHAGSYSGHDLYYKRAAGAYPVSQMHKVKDLAELNRLIAMPAHRLPKAARGEFPKGEALKELRVRAAKERAYNNARSKASKAAKRAAGVDPYKPRG